MVWDDQGIPDAGMLWGMLSARRRPGDVVLGLLSQALLSSLLLHSKIKLGYGTEYGALVIFKGSLLHLEVPVGFRGNQAGSEIRCSSAPQERCLRGIITYSAEILDVDVIW